jgi:hypothetical protein
LVARTDAHPESRNGVLEQRAFANGPTMGIDEGVMTIKQKGKNTAEAAAYLGISKSTLEHYRETKGKGPRYSQNGRIIRYDDPDLDEWDESRKITSRVEYVTRQQSEKAAEHHQPATSKSHQPKSRKQQLKPRTPSDPEG